MMERPTTASASARPKTSETDPPAANQPVHDDKAADASKSDEAPATTPRPEPAPEIVPGKPDGEVDTRH
jgi:hypothetical protein